MDEVTYRKRKNYTALLILKLFEYHIRGNVYIHQKFSNFSRLANAV